MSVKCKRKQWKTGWLCETTQAHKLRLYTAFTCLLYPQIGALVEEACPLGCITQGSLVEIFAEPLVGDFHKRTLKNWCTIWRPHSVCSDDSRGGVNGRMVA